MENRYCDIPVVLDPTKHPKFNPDMVALLTHFIKERQSIYHRRRAGESAPWTDDPVLNEYRFTNVFREYDRVTKELLHYIAKNKWLSLEDRIINIIIFRLFNRLDSWQSLGGPFKAEHFKPENQVEVLTYLRGRLDEVERHHEGKVDWFTDAFFTSGIKSSNKSLNSGEAIEKRMALRPFFILVRAFRDYPDWIQRIIDAESPQAVFDTLIECCHGIGRFLAYQMFVDMTYMDDFQFSENHFTIAGPGCIVGLKHLVVDFDKMSYEDVLHYIIRHQERILPDLSESDFSERPFGEQCLNVMALENVFCEFGKYVRLRAAGRGRARKYPHPRKLPDNLLED